MKLVSALVLVYTNKLVIHYSLSYGTDRSGSNGNITCFVFDMYQVRIWVRRSTILTEIIRDFSLIHPAECREQYLQFGRHRCLVSQFIVHQLFHHSVVKPI
jgi:hypothetical protein